eukprot:COSAG01_NODE_2596_length_7401_cov_12.151055_8_plen_54_part_00
MSNRLPHNPMTIGSGVRENMKEMTGRANTPLYKLHKEMTERANTLLYKLHIRR